MALPKPLPATLTKPLPTIMKPPAAETLNRHAVYAFVLLVFCAF
jgi:hypothetical protein